MHTLKFRHELKFVCSEYELFLIENKIKNVCILDSNTKEENSYLIRSLYFDTFNNNYYHENKMGIDNRKKYRIRIYNMNSEIIKLECKYSYHGMKAKEVCNITAKQFDDIINGLPLTTIHPQQHLLFKFMTDKQLYLLTPKVIIEYTRTPYIHKAGNVRVTFDRNIYSSTDFNNFFNNKICKRGILSENTHVLEVKYDEFLPAGILEILARGQNLRNISFSKYMLCRDYNL